MDTTSAVWKLTCALGLALALAACGHDPVDTEAAATWPLSEVAALDAQAIVLADAGRPRGNISSRQAKLIEEVARRMLAIAGGDAPPRVLLVEGTQANAFATPIHGGVAIVGINLGMVALLGDDRAAWAALIGHELAHLALHHVASQKRRRADEEDKGSLLSVVLGIAGVPFGGAIADAAMVAVDRSYSRDDEREADRTGFDYMVRAGFDPEGAVRLQRKLAVAGGGETVRFLATHPGGTERVSAMQQLVDEFRAGTPAR